VDKTLDVLAQTKCGGDSNLCLRKNMVRQMSEELVIIAKAALTLVALVVIFKFTKAIFTEDD